MKVKTFTGTHRFAVDNQVNDWLAKSNVTRVLCYQRRVCPDLLHKGHTG